MNRRKERSEGGRDGGREEERCVLFGFAVSTFSSGFKHKPESFLELESPLSLPGDAKEIWELAGL